MSGVKSAATKELYSGRMAAFLSRAGLGPDDFARMQPKRAQAAVSDYIAALVARAQAGEIAAGTVRASVAPIRTFCDMNEMEGVNWRLLNKKLPAARGDADDRAPTVDEVRALLGQAPMRLRAAILMQLSGGFRSGAFDFFTVRDLEDAKGGAGCAWLTVYRGEPEQYRCLITPEANAAVKEYLAWREAHGEPLSQSSPLFRDTFDTGRGYKGTARRVKPMKSEVYGRDLNRLWHKSGVWSETLGMGGRARRQPFKATHGLRKLFTTLTQASGAKDLAMATLEGRSAGVRGNSYYRPSEAELLAEYLKAVPALTVSGELRKQAEMDALRAGHKTETASVRLELLETRQKVEDEQADLAERVKSLTSTLNAVTAQLAAMTARQEALDRAKAASGANPQQ